MTRMIHVLPGSTTYRLKTTAEIYQTEWKLTETETDGLQTYSLRHWNISELLEYAQFGPDGIHLTVRLWNVVYSATLQVSAKTHSMLSYLLYKEHGWRDPINDKQPMFWLSFRAGKLDGQDFAWVIIQEDKGGERKWR